MKLAIAIVHILTGLVWIVTGFLELLKELEPPDHAARH